MTWINEWPPRKCYGQCMARPLALCLGLALLSSLVGGLARLLPLTFCPELFASGGKPGFLVEHHGVLMAGVLFPGLIALERAVAIGRRPAWLAPAAAPLSLLALAALGRQAYPFLMLAAAGLLLQQLYLWRLRPGAAGALPVAAALILGLTDWRWGQAVPPLYCAAGWGTFLLLVIAAERLELSFVSSARTLSFWPAAGLALGAVVAESPRWLGLSWLLMGLWLLRHDLAGRNARRQGLTAFTARAVLAGYAWLCLAGAQLAWYGLGPRLDAVLHGLFVGFVLSMVMAHAPLVLPAVCRLPVRHSAWFYLPLGLLHLSLAVRCLGWLAAGATGNLLAVLAFAGVMIGHHAPGHNAWVQARNR